MFNLKKPEKISNDYVLGIKKKQLLLLFLLILEFVGVLDSVKNEVIFLNF
jgi:hypothetical protein